MESTDSSSGSQQQQQPQLPPGFRFHPTDEELVVHYLKRKAASVPLPVTIIAEVDLYKFDPWELPGRANFGEQEWYFFSPRDRKYPNGARPNRAATSGYWKATGTDKPIMSSASHKKVGVKKALVFYGGKPPKGIKTNWIMHEYRLITDTNRPNTSTHDSNGSSNTVSATANKKASLRLDDWVLCRIYKKNNCGSNNGIISSNSGSSCTHRMHLMERDNDESMDNVMLQVSSASEEANPLQSVHQLATTAAAISRLQQPQMLHQTQHQNATNYSSALLDNDETFFQGLLSSHTPNIHDHQEDGDTNPMSTTTIFQLGSSSSSASAAVVAVHEAKGSLSATPTFWCGPPAAAAAGSSVINPPPPPPSSKRIFQQAYDSSRSNSNNNNNKNSRGTNSSNSHDTVDNGGGRHTATMEKTLLNHQNSIPQASNYHHHNHSSAMESVLLGDGNNNSNGSVFRQVPYQLLSSINWRTSS